MIPTRSTFKTQNQIKNFERKKWKIILICSTFITLDYCCCRKVSAHKPKRWGLHNWEVAFTFSFFLLLSLSNLCFVAKFKLRNLLATFATNAYGPICPAICLPSSLSNQLMSIYKAFYQSSQKMATNSYPAIYIRWLSHLPSFKSLFWNKFNHTALEVGWFDKWVGKGV